MNKPLLIVVTGRPAAGKTTLAHRLAQQTGFPLLSRDALKGGFVDARGRPPDGEDAAGDRRVYEIFFDTVERWVANGVSLIAEAAYQHRLWHPGLSGLLDKADVRIVVCEVAPAVAKKRFLARLTTDPNRRRVHGERPEILTGGKTAALIGAYENVRLDVPVLHVDTTAGYRPDYAALVAFVTR